ncbi:MAG: NADH:ubiquinone reductase (Na(+)-transporting) subunit F [bacterium]
MNYLISIIVMCGIAAIIGIIIIIAEYLFANYGECKIRINDSIELLVNGGRSLLSYLFDNKIFIPSACGGKAVCGFCKVKVINGGGLVLPLEKPFLTRDEILNNIRLACQVKVTSDIEILIPDEYLAILEYRAKVSKIRDLNYDTKEIILNLEEPENISFKPGQYIQLQVPGTCEYRAYSIASTPEQSNIIRLVVRLVPGGICSTYIHEQLKEGDEVFFTGPFGNLVLNEDSNSDIIAVAGGCGIAPFMSMIFHLLKKGSKRNIRLFFGVRTEADLYFVEEFQKCSEAYDNFEIHISLSEPSKDWQGETGLIHQLVDKYIERADNASAYLCGPSAMIDAVINVLLSKGIARNRIFFDAF